MSTPVQPLRTIKIVRNGTAAYIRFMPNYAQEGQSSTLAVGDDGTITFTGSNAASGVNYIRQLTADPAILKRLWTENSAGTIRSQVVVNGEGDSTQPTAALKTANNTTGASSMVEVSLSAVALEARAGSAASNIDMTAAGVAMAGQAVNVHTPQFRLDNGSSGTPSQVFMNNIQLDIFAPQNNEAIMYDSASNTYKPKNVASVVPGPVPLVPVSFMYTVSGGAVAFALPAGCVDLLYLTTGSGQTIDPTTGWTVNAAAGTFTLSSALPAGTTKLYGKAFKDGAQLSGSNSVLIALQNQVNSLQLLLNNHIAAGAG